MRYVMDATEVQRAPARARSRPALAQPDLRPPAPARSHSGEAWETHRDREQQRRRAQSAAGRDIGRIPPRSPTRSAARQQRASCASSARPTAARSSGWPGAPTTSRSWTACRRRSDWAGSSPWRTRAATGRPRDANGVRCTPC